MTLENTFAYFSVHILPEATSILIPLSINEFAYFRFIQVES